MNQAAPVKEAPRATGCTAAAKYSLADVAKHAAKDDCWLVIDDGVFDITAWINGAHPGGFAPAPYCGTDATKMWYAQSQHGHVTPKGDRFCVGTLEASCHVGVNGDAGYCSESCKCDAGEGDCDNDDQCEADAACANNVGEEYDCGGSPCPASRDFCQRTKRPTTFPTTRATKAPTARATKAPTARGRPVTQDPSKPPDTSAAAVSTGAPTASSEAPEDETSSISTGAIAGIAGAVFLVAVVAVFVLKGKGNGDGAEGDQKQGPGGGGLSINPNAQAIAVGSRAMAKGMSPQNVGRRNPAQRLRPANSYNPFDSKLKKNRSSAMAMQRNPMSHLCATPRHKPNASAPPQWQQLWDPSNQMNYYHNQQTGETQWEPPVEGYTTFALSPR